METVKGGGGVDESSGDMVASSSASQPSERLEGDARRKWPSEEMDEELDLWLDGGDVRRANITFLNSDLR